MNRVDFWDFGFQPGSLVNFTIEPGDRINTHCVYKERSTGPTRFDESSTDEMCIQYLFYYPKIVEVLFLIILSVLRISVRSITPRIKKGTLPSVLIIFLWWILTFRYPFLYIFLL
jgi:hypothetical protein